MADNDSKPLVQLDADGVPAVLNYNVPEPTSYTGRNLIKLEYDASVFKNLIGEDPLPDLAADDDDATTIDKVNDWLIDRSAVTLPASVLDGLTTSGDDGGGGGAGGGGAGGGGSGGAGEVEIDLPKDPQEPDITSTVRRTAAALRARGLRPSRAGRARASALPASAGSVKPVSSIRSRAAALDKDVLVANVAAGNLPYLVKTATGGTKIVYANIGELPNPGIYLVETYRMSNFLGDYGAGRTVGTFSLLPGEKTKISITTYKSSSTTATAASSIFDSYTTTAEDELESTIQSESSDTESRDQTTEWDVQAEASGNWGVASASVSAGASRSTNTAREEFSKNVASATEKHAQTASAQRDVTVNSTTTSTVETGEETAIEREIQNINVSRALNFVFRQLNQEHISLLHLVDVRVGFFNGYVDTKMEVPLHDIDRLLDYCVTAQADRDTIKADILYALRNIHDYRNAPQNFLRDPPHTFVERDGTVQTVDVIDRARTSVYESPGRAITVEGIILSARTVVLRTDAVIVEALLGQASALDDYSIGLQDERVREKQLANDAAELALEERRARLQILARGDAAAADVWAKLFAEGIVEGEPGGDPGEGAG